VSLRTRLWLVLGCLFLVPLIVGGLVLLAVVPGAASDRADTTVRTAATALSGELADECRLLGLAARTPALEAEVSGPAKAVTVAVDGGYADYAALLEPDGTVVAEAGRLPAVVGSPADLPSCTRDRAAPKGAVLAERVEVTSADGPTTAVVARTMTKPFLLDLLARTGAEGEVLLVSGDKVVASTAGPEQTREIAAAVPSGTGTAEVDGWTVGVRQARSGVPYRVVVAVPEGSGDSNLMLVLLIMAVGALAAGLLVLVVARGLSQPFTELTEAAEKVAQGELDTTISGGVEGEAGRLGSAFKQMTGELRRSLNELESSREDLRSSLERIGDALSSTHDLDRLLTVVLETARATLGAEAGVVLYRAAEHLRLVNGQGLEQAGLPAPTAVTPGVGVLGQVVVTGTTVRGQIGSGPEALEPDASEPTNCDVLAVPLRSMGQIVGVVALYNRVDGRSFDEEDEDALGTLVGQASIAVDNVQLHNEAQRLSTTDPLTGLWNFRYLSMSLAREIERSTRFARPLAVLMLDLDHFKAVNDTHGHQRGDTVLRELAHRVQEQIREVDTFARYGGEEFVVVLPETTVEGASQLAERICEAVRREPFVHENEEPLQVTVSVGGAAFPDHGSSPATLMRAADKALYVAKAEGRDRWHVPDA
jgi:two-component system cell cycle response regulator